MIGARESGLGFLAKARVRGKRAKVGETTHPRDRNWTIRN
jgi:hypothetical protein